MLNYYANVLELELELTHAQKRQQLFKKRSRRKSDYSKNIETI